MNDHERRILDMREVLKKTYDPKNSLLLADELAMALRHQAISVEEFNAKVNEFAAAQRASGEFSKP